MREQKARVIADVAAIIRSLQGAQEIQHVLHLRWVQGVEPVYDAIGF
jgi:hypothetical protein